MKKKDITFSDVIESSSKVRERWGSLIPNDTKCILAIYEQGEAITDAKLAYHEIEKDFPEPLGIIINGRAEIHEMCATDFTAYRPIRILKEADLFGEFSILDKLHGFDGKGLPGETWKINAGFKSAIITKIMNDSEGLIWGEGVVSFHKLLDKIVDSKTVVAFIDSAQVVKDKSFSDKLHHYAWPRVKIYRDGINSFNYLRKLKFERDAMARIINLAGSAKATQKKYDIGKSKVSTFRPLFVEAIYDACNRPLRGEPMFVKGNDLPIKSQYKNDLAGTGLEVSDILVAVEKDSYKTKDFWFPLDLANHMIAAYADNTTLMEIVVSGPDDNEFFEKRTRDVIKSMDIDAEIIRAAVSKDNRFNLKVNNNNIYSEKKMPDDLDLVRLFTKAKKDAIPERDTSFIKEVKRLYGDRIRAPKKKTDVSPPNPKLSTRLYYTDIANKLLNELVVNSVHYHYNVKCVDIPGYKHNHSYLMLHFKER